MIVKRLYFNILLLAYFHFSLSEKPENVLFVHVGKAGGTSARNNFLNTFKKSSLNISYVHCQRPDTEKFDTYVVTIRNPIDRMVSWFLYTHPKNKIRHVSSKGKNIYDCYEQVDDLATDGLDRKASGTLDDCQQLARDVIKGNVKGHDEYVHITRNYSFYISELLLQADNKNIYVIRTEHLMDDWINAAEDIVRKSGISVNINTKDTHVTHREGKSPVVTNRELSKEGLQNACFFLCNEIQLYKQIINKAINLDLHEKSRSFHDLAKYCPKEAISRKCDSTY